MIQSLPRAADCYATTTQCARPCGSERASGSIIDGPGQEGAIAGRPAHDHWMNSPSSGRIQPTIPMIAPLSIQTAGLTHGSSGARALLPSIPAISRRHYAPIGGRRRWAAQARSSRTRISGAFIRSWPRASAPPRRLRTIHHIAHFPKVIGPIASHEDYEIAP
jgi:hypothetical protein